MPFFQALWSCVVAVATWLRAHPEFTALVAWPILTGALTLFFKPRTPEQYLKIAEVAPRLASFLKLVAALGFDPVKATKVVRELASGGTDPSKDSKS